MSTRTVVVSGPRAWPPAWRETVWAVLDWQRARLGPGDTFRLVHGAADGVDTFAQQWADTRTAEGGDGPVIDVRDYPRPAWAAHHDGCPPGCTRTVHREHGPRRNALMLDQAAPDLALVFLYDGPPEEKSRGSAGCLEEIKARRIPAFVTMAWSEPPRRRTEG